LTETYNATGGTHEAGAFTGVDLTDGALFDGLTGTQGAVVLQVGDRILVKNQIDAKQNGIYVVTTAGATGAIERASDHDGDPGAEVSAGNFIFLENGALFENNGFVLTGDGILTVNTDDLVWVQFSGAGLLTAGDGLVKTGNVIDVDLATDPGLEFSGNQLRVKTKSGGGVVRDADGLSIDTGDLSSDLAGDGLVANGGAIDVNPGDGIEVVSDKVAVALATNPALEFETGELRVKIKADSGIVRDADGLSINTADLTETLAGDGLVDNGAAIDVNPGDGIAVVSDMVVVDLAADPGLEFNLGDLRVKTKAAGGVVRDADGLSVDTADLTEALAGDGLVDNGAAIDVNPGDGIAIVSDQVVVDLATDPGLEFNAGDLQVKVKTGGGVVRDADGLSIDTGDLSSDLAGDGLVANGTAIDVNPGDGIAVVSDKVVVNLAADPGLEFETGELQAKVKTAGGITRDVDGLSVDSSTIAGDGLVATGHVLDVNPGDGIAVVSDMVVVDLATDPGLEFNAGDLQVKTKTGGGVVRDADGLSIDTGDLSSDLAGDGLVANGGAIDVNPGDGIAVVSDMVVVDLATDSGLEFNAGDLQVKVKTGGGVVRDADGLSIDTGDLSSDLAGDGLVANGAAIDVNPGDGIQLVSDQVAVKYTEAFVNDNAGAITVGQVVYVKANGAVDLAQATLPNLDQHMIGVVGEASIATTASGEIYTRKGAIIGGFSGLTPGRKQYVSRSSAGGLTEVLTGFQGGDMVYSVGRAISASQIEYDPQFEIEY
jgi:hypothetical protein